MKKVELLAPAGNYEALTGAVMAGADAVYLGGELFGARAYADNFTQEEICTGIRFAHVFNRKIYLTVNTLVKEKEFDSLYYFLLPFYDAGLDGVIIQDLGVFKFIKEHFPGLALHISTQMTVTGVRGARLLKAEGAARVVPARELSLEEMKSIRKEAGIEVEAFIHGAMCYCYSGQCLFSSILGGRSGNRGRCAQPCRLPYELNGGKEKYLLSMKDMCTLNILPQLMEAGIDSFKIEGRMKKPEYAAGVTAIYRKYIDLYDQNPNAYWVDHNDMEFLQSLYIRSGIGEGYCHTHNGKAMITLDSPAYSGSDEALLKKIRKDYLEQLPVLSVCAEIVLKKNEPAVLNLRSGKISLQISGETVQEARKQPLTEEKIREQILKSGNTCFNISNVKIIADEDIFMPVGQLNQLRREGLKGLEQAVIASNDLSYEQRKANFPIHELKENQWKKTKETEASIHVLINTEEQLKTALTQGVDRVYIDRCRPESEWPEELWKRVKETKAELYLVFPFIVRKKDEKKLEKMWQQLNTGLYQGALIRNLESFAFLKEKGMKKNIVADANLYVWNREAVKFLKNQVNEVYLPLEENFHEWKELLENRSEAPDVSAMVYGRLPMMVTANCVKKTTDSCNSKMGYEILRDRYRKEFPVYTECNYCYNIIYNSVPLSLHKLFQKQVPAGITAFRLDFTVENEEQVCEIIQYFNEIRLQYKEPFYKEYTTGHFKRGVE